MITTPRWPTLKYGQSGPNVYALQCLINARMSKITVTGTFDQATKQSVENFQRQNNLPVTQEADESVLSRMVAIVRQVKDPSTSYMSQAAQFLLSKFESVSVDGKFGSGSATAVATFQIRMGIPIAGIVNSQTWQYLFGYNSYPSSQITHPSTAVYASVCAFNSTLTSVQMAKNAKYICDWLMTEQNFTKNAACGVLGNMQVESHINPGIWEVMADTNFGYGLVQWTKATQFLDWAVGKSILQSASPSTVNALAFDDPERLMDAELECLIWDCTKSPSEFGNPDDYGYTNHTGITITFSAYKASTRDAGTLAKVFQDHYERGDSSSLATRATYANNWYKQL